MTNDMGKPIFSSCKLLRLAAGITALFIVMGDYPAIAQERTEREAAARGLELLREIVQKPTFKQTFQSYGFDSPEQATDLQFGRPLQIHWVRLDRLRQFQPESDAEQLLETPIEVMYPVQTGEKVTTSITVVKSPSHGKWKASRFGSARLIRRLTEFPQYKNSLSSFLVRIPDLNLYFLGDRINGQLRLTAIADRPDSHWEAGQTLPAQEAFVRLVPAAKARGRGPG